MTDIHNLAVSKFAPEVKDVGLGVFAVLSLKDSLKSG